MGRTVLDVNGCFGASAGGLTRGDLSTLESTAQSVFEKFEARRRAGEIGFPDLPQSRELSRETTALARELSARFDNLIVLGIGGSSLGGRALVNALAHPFNNHLPRARRTGMRVFFPDNSDPVTFDGLLSALDLAETAFATITKSGGTAETMAQHLVLRERCIVRFGMDGYRERCVLVTDPAKGALRKIAADEQLRALSVPANIGGRFSAMSPVGLLPAAAVGVDIEALLDGAAAMEARCRSGSPLENPALLFASVMHLADVKSGRRIHVVMPYADGLRDLGDWFVQLWAESLGKSERVGPTPFRAVGATDQHSSLQLMMEGPNDKIVALIAVQTPRAEVPLVVPESYREHAEIAYLHGHSMRELIDAEQIATEAALWRAGRPTLTVTVPRLDARAMGELVMFFELATAYAGGLYGVNPFDQPGVEAGKRYAQGLLGRPGFEKYREELLARPARDPGYVLG